MKSKNHARTRLPSLLAMTAGLALAVGAAACAKSESDSEPTEQAESPAAAGTQPDKEAPKAAPAAEPGETPQLEGVLTAYQAIHAQLAQDDVKGAVESAAKLQAAAAAAGKSAPAAVQPHLSSLATAAAALSDVPPAEPDAVRKAFGEVSKPMVELLSAVPELREGWHVFECPMAQGYKKWAQPSDQISNPYMGTKMPTCGGETDWPTAG